VLLFISITTLSVVIHIKQQNKRFNIYFNSHNTVKDKKQKQAEGQKYIQKHNNMYMKVKHMQK